MKKVPRKIVSGGQTGADRAGLDFALENSIECGGWCPAGRLAEDGRIEERYPLEETEEKDYSARTERNIIDSDGTLIVVPSSDYLSGGTGFTIICAQKHGRPLFVADFSCSSSGDLAADCLRWIEEFSVETLNVAGPRGSKAPGVYEMVFELLNGIYKIKEGNECNEQ